MSDDDDKAKKVGTNCTPDSARKKGAENYVRVMEDLRELRHIVLDAGTAPPDVVLAGYRYMQRKTIIGCLQDFYSQGGSLRDSAHKITKLVSLSIYHNYDLEKNKNQYLHKLLDHLRSIFDSRIHKNGRKRKLVKTKMINQQLPQKRTFSVAKNHSQDDEIIAASPNDDAQMSVDRFMTIKEKHDMH